MIKSRIRSLSSDRATTRRSSCDGRTYTGIAITRGAGGRDSRFKRQVRGKAHRQTRQTPSAPMIKPRILRLLYGKAADEAELMRRSVGRRMMETKKRIRLQFHKMSPRRRALKGSERNAPRRPRGKCALLRNSGASKGACFRVTNSKKPRRDMLLPARDRRLDADAPFPSQIL